MYEYTTDHALKNVWCNPDQDRQHILAIHRITPPLGVFNAVSVMMRPILLPSKTERYHVFQIGHVNPLFLGLLTDTPDWQVAKWVNIPTAMNAGKLMVDIYTDSGVQIPKFQSYYMLTNDGTLLTAIKESSKIKVAYGSTQLYVRFYSNAFYSIPVTGATNKGISTRGAVLMTTADILTMQSECIALLNLPGHLSVFKNGLLTDAVDLLNYAVGDVCEWVHDASVFEVVDLKLSDLPTFSSILDSKLKYLLHHKTASNHIIRYHDDVDFYVFAETLSLSGKLRFTGSYYHRNVTSSCRMVTHCDYSLTAQNITNQLHNLTTLMGVPAIDSGKVTVRMVIRNSGYDRPLVFESNKIHELYKLDEASILQAMVDANSTVAAWKAANLENSAYCKVMRTPVEGLTKQLVEDAYGYNGLSMILAATPSLTVPWSNGRCIDVPFALRVNSTAFEYNFDGLMTSTHVHGQSDVYVCRDQGTKYVEMFAGEGSHRPDVRFGTTNIPVPSDFDYRVYMQNVSNNGPWVDVTGNGLYTVVDGLLKCDIRDYEYLLMVRTDAKFLSYSFDIPAIEGVLSFTLSEMEDRGNGAMHYELPVPMGKWDIFMFGRVLTEGLDYMINFPEVTIISKEHLNSIENTLQHVHIRGSGFCDEHLQWETPTTVGFIEHGMLLGNHRHDIIDDKVQHISVDGMIKHKSEILVSDDTIGVDILNANNGRPYRVQETYVPLSGYAATDTNQLRVIANGIDRSVSDYMTLKHPEPTRAAVSAIPSRYKVYSPFISRLITILSHGELDNTLTSAVLSDMRVIEICQPYEYLLKVDPIRGPKPVDTRYVTIDPYIGSIDISLNLFQYRFINKVVSLYCNGLMNLSSFVVLR